MSYLSRHPSVLVNSWLAGFALENRASRGGTNSFGSTPLELFEEMNAFAACFTEKLASFHTKGAQARAMIHPGHLGRHAKQDLELCAPQLTLEREQPPLEIAQPIGVEIDVPGFVTQDPIASLFEHRVARLPV